MDLSLRIVQFYRSWQHFVTQVESFEKSKWVMIDDLALDCTPPLSLNSKTQTLDKLKKLILEVDNSKWPTKIKNETIIRLEDSVRYINLDKVTKNSISSLCGDWWEIPEEEILEISQEFNKFKHLTSSLEEVIPTSKFLIMLEDKSKSYYDTILRKLGINLSPKLNIKSVNLESKWRNMVTYENKEINLVINTNPIHQYTKLQAYSYAIHEVCGHVLHFNYILHHQLEYPHLNQICIHNRSSIFIEGFAHYMHKYFSHEVETNEILQSSFLYFKLRFALIQKNSMDIVEKNISALEAAIYHSKYTGEDIKNLEKQYFILSQSPFFMYQVHSYHNGLRKFEALESTFSSKETFIKSMLNNRLMASAL